MQYELDREKPGKYSIGMRAGTRNGVSGNKGDMAGNGGK